MDTKKLRGCFKKEYMMEREKCRIYCEKDPDFSKFNLNLEIY